MREFKTTESQREKARLAYWKLFEGKTSEEIEVIRERLRVRNRAVYRRRKTNMSPEAKEELRLRRNRLMLARYHANREHYKAKMRRGHLTPEQIEKKRAAARAYRLKHRTRILEQGRARRARESPEKRAIRLARGNVYNERRRKHDPYYRILYSLRARMNGFFKRGVRKVARSVELCGEGFLEHIERELKPGMSLYEDRRKTWHIDHVIPCAWFDLNDEEHQRVCFHWSNLQPEFAFHNLSKVDTCSLASVDRVLARCPATHRPLLQQMRERAEREEQVRRLSSTPS